MNSKIVYLFHKLINYHQQWMRLGIYNFKYGCVLQHNPHPCWNRVLWTKLGTCCERGKSLGVSNFVETFWVFFASREAFLGARIVAMPILPLFLVLPSWDDHGEVTPLSSWKPSCYPYIICHGSFLKLWYSLYIYKTFFIFLEIF